MSSWQTVQTKYSGDSLFMLILPSFVAIMFLEHELFRGLNNSCTSVYADYFIKWGIVFIIASMDIESKQGRFWDGRERDLLLEEGLDIAQTVVATYANNKHYFLPAKGIERCCRMGIKDLDKESKQGRF
jgi:hypothetical protein